MHVQANKLVIPKDEFLLIGKTAGWFDPIKDYWKGLNQVRDIRSQSPENRQAYWNAFESTPGIGKGLSQYQQNLKQDITKFQQIAKEAELIRHYRAQPQLQQSVPQLKDRLGNAQQTLQSLYDSLSPTGQQIFNQAIQNLKVLVHNSEIPLEQMADVATQATKLCNQMIQQAGTQPLDFSRPEAFTPEAFGAAEKIINEVLKMPIGVQYKIVAQLTEKLQNNPELERAAQPQPQPA
jgi:predicted transcriptional regulator